jgi:hypothetical protein
VAPVVIHLTNFLKYFLFLFFVPGVNVLLQLWHLYLNERDFECPHLYALNLQKGQKV